MIAFVNWKREVRLLRNVLLRIFTSRHLPLSYQPCASPARRIAEPATLEKLLPSTSTGLGVVKSAPRARLLRTTLFLKVTEG